MPHFHILQYSSQGMPVAKKHFRDVLWIIFPMQADVALCIWGFCMA